MIELQAQVQKEFDMGRQHIENEVKRKDKILKKLLAIPEEGEIKVHLLYKNIKLENALFSADKLNIDIVTSRGVLAEEATANLKKVLQYDYVDSEMEYDDLDIRMYNGLYGLAVRVPVGYDTINEQPIYQVINPLNTIPDPKNYRGSKMRFFGVTRRASIEELRLDPSYNTEQIDILEAIRDSELVEREQNKNYNTRTTEIFDNSGYVDIYDHYTIYKGEKIFTTWAGNKSVLLRKVTIGKLDGREIFRPDKVDFGISFYRRSPITGSYFGGSIADEVLQYQDAISILQNQRVIGANIQANGNDLFYDDSLDIDEGILSTSKPGGRIIPVTVDEDSGKTIRDMFAEKPSTQNPGQFIEQVIRDLNGLSSETVGVPDITFGQSLPGSQTKSEIQTLMSNANVLLADIGANYMRGEKDFWKSFINSYIKNMPKGKTKFIANFTNGEKETLNLKKADFVPDGKFQVYIESEKQVKAKKDKDFAKLSSVIGTFLQNLPQGSPQANRLLRDFGKLITIDGFNPNSYITLNKDERVAYNRVEHLLNNNIDIEKPQPGEDYETHLYIYKLGVKTEARDRAIRNYEKMIMEAQKPTTMGQADNTTSAIAGNIVSSELSSNNQNASLSNITQ